MTCRDVASFILDYSTGELPPTLRVRFERHLSRCPDCRAYLAQYLAAIDLGRHTCLEDDAAAVDAGVPEELVAAILAART